MIDLRLVASIVVPACFFLIFTDDHVGRCSFALTPSSLIIARSSLTVIALHIRFVTAIVNELMAKPVFLCFYEFPGWPQRRPTAGC